MVPTDSPEPAVFIVDDDASVRTAMKRLLTSVAIRCETFDDARAFLERVDDDMTGCLLLDVRMPGLSGIDLQRVLRERGNDLPIIFVTAYADVPLTVRAMKAGAVEVLTKPVDEQRLLEAVSDALERERARRAGRAEERRWRERFSTLTAREREVMALVVTGMLNKQIAETLGTAEKTIKVHRGQVMHKMQAESVADLVRMADRLARSPGR